MRQVGRSDSVPHLEHKEATAAAAPCHGAAPGVEPRPSSLAQDPVPYKARNGSGNCTVWACFVFLDIDPPVGPTINGNGQENTT